MLNNLFRTIDFSFATKSGSLASPGVTLGAKLRLVVETARRVWH